MVVVLIFDKSIQATIAARSADTDDVSYPSVSADLATIVACIDTTNISLAIPLHC